MNIYNQIVSRKEKGLKQFAILLDPDKSTDADFTPDRISKSAKKSYLVRNEDIVKAWKINYLESLFIFQAQ